MLSHGRIVRIENNTYIWQPSSEKDAFFLRSVGREEKKKQIEAALSELTGEPCGFNTAEIGSESPKEALSEQAYIESLYQTFGKEPVDIVE